MTFKPALVAMAVAHAFVVLPASVAAEDLAAIEKITIVGHKEDPTKTTGSAYVVSEKELQKFEFTNVHSILRSVPGVYVREEDGQGTFPRIGIRASSSGRSDRIAIMEDGIPAAMAPYANTSAYYFPNVGRMSAVEVLKGPEVMFYGPQTATGAVNLVSTPIPTEAKGFLNAELANFDGKKIHANYGATEGQWAYLLETYQKENDGFHQIDRSTRDAGMDQTEYLAKLRWQSAAEARFKQSVNLKFLNADEINNVSYLGVTDADFAENPDRRYGLSELEQMRRGRESISLQHQIELAADTNLTTTLYRNQTYRNYKRLNQINGVGIGNTGLNWIVNNQLAGTNPHNGAALLQGILHGTADTTHANGVRYGLNYQNFDSKGAQIELDQGFVTGELSHNLRAGVRRHEDEAFSLGGAQVIYDQRNGGLIFNSEVAGTVTPSDAKATAYWVADEISYQNWLFLPVVRHENIKSRANLNAVQTELNSNDLTKTTAGLGINYALSGEWTLLAGMHQGFAPPGSTAVQGTEGEESDNYEAGVRFRRDQTGVDIVSFYSDYSNALRNCSVANSCPDGRVDGTLQTGSKEVYGVEIGAYSELYRQGAYVMPIRATYTYSDGEYTQASDSAPGVEKGDVLDYTPKHIGSVQVGLEYDTLWQSYMVFSYVDGSCTTTTCGRAGVDDEFLATESLFSVDWSLTYRINEFTQVYGKVENLFDQQRITHRGSDGARGNSGRTGALGLRVSF
ncbi:TonB-dependent receptor family protein [Rheinheimera soli]|uniref:TonB-dependent receptor family protein n=1 Tax=Rheinheimera soli TaxID=443616 RepID=UPI001E4F5293|nr:TonB-dependent receptor [Rheinheimera soli]